MEEPNFGTYHHSNAKQSQKMREIARKIFIDAFSRTGFLANDALVIADVGCGLGFLTSIVAEYFPNSRIYAIDTFRHSSLKNNSIEILRRNMQILGLENRVQIVQADISSKIPIPERVDLAVSNLVIHNIGRKRFVAYRNIHEILKPDSFFLNADGFIQRTKTIDPMEFDLNKIKDYFRLEFLIKPPMYIDSSRWKYALIGLRSVNL